MDFRIKNKKLEYRANFLNNWRPYPNVENIEGEKNLIDWVEKYKVFCNSKPEYQKIKVNLIKQ